MKTLATAATIFACSFGAGLVGMGLHVKLPDHHRDVGSKDVVKLVMSLIASMAALVLSLLIASGSSFYQAQENEVQSLAADIILLDRLLSFYGPEAKESRDQLHQAVAEIYDRIWSPDRTQPPNLDPRTTQDKSNAFVAGLQALSPTNESQSILKSQVMQVSQNLGHIRLLMFEQSAPSISLPFLTVLAFWICVLFLGFGIFTQFNATVTVALMIGAASVASAIFLILELNHPYQGFMKIADTPLRVALALMDK